MPPHLPETAQDLINRLLQKVPNFRITLDEIRNHPFLSEVRIHFLNQKCVTKR